jgi:excisionase family DNA binding protein
MTVVSALVRHVCFPEPSASAEPPRASSVRKRLSLVAFPGEGCHAAPDTAEEKDMDPLLIKIPDAAAQLGVSRAKLYELIATGALPAVKVDGCRRIRTQDLYDFVARLATSATATRSPGH